MRTWSMLVFLLLLNNDIAAQTFVLTAIGERTVAGYELGGSVQMETKGRWRMGAFYQTAVDRRMALEGGEKDQFFGVSLSLPLVKSDKMFFYAVARPGIVNNKFMVFVPGFETDIPLAKNISCGVGTSLRKGFVAAFLKLNYKI